MLLVVFKITVCRDVESGHIGVRSVDFRDGGKGAELLSSLLSWRNVL